MEQTVKIEIRKKNQLYNKEGLMWEDTLWAFYLIRCVNHVVFINDVTYIYKCRPDSIIISSKDEEKLKHFGNIFREMAEQIIPGERIYEVECWYRFFCINYLEAWNNSDYKYTFSVFLSQLSDGRHRMAVFL